MFDTSYIYLFLAIGVGAAALLVIPKKHYKHYFLYGLLFGGVGDILLATIFTYAGWIKYKNMGPFNVLGLFSFWTPITWMFAYTIFFYFLPVRKVFLIPYLLAFAGLNYGTGLFMENFGLFQYYGINRYVAPLTFFAWYSISAWVYFKNEKVTLK